MEVLRNKSPNSGESEAGSGGIAVATMVDRSIVTPHHDQWRSVRPKRVHRPHVGLVEVYVCRTALGIVGSTQIISAPSCRVERDWLGFANEWLSRRFVVGRRVAIANQLRRPTVGKPASLVPSVGVCVPAFRVLHTTVALLSVLHIEMSGAVRISIDGHPWATRRPETGSPPEQ
jgi:hypothetical protein